MPPDLLDNGTTIDDRLAETSESMHGDEGMDIESNVVLRGTSARAKRQLDFSAHSRRGSPSSTGSLPQGGVPELNAGA